MQPSKNVIIAIPLYKNTFKSFEIVSLKSIFKHLGSFPIAFVVPQSLNTDFLQSYNFISNYSIERFDDHFFKSIDNYNLLMLSTDFYQRFADYTYTLICQTDVFVFENQLEHWTTKNYDYIGAPWLDSSYNPLYLSYRRFFNTLKKLITGREKLYPHINKVGNGGFSLRKNQAFIDICKKEQQQIQDFQTNKTKDNYHIEDVFWSLYTPTKHNIKIPKYTEAVYFAWDINPKMAMKFTKGKLPFACHGFNKKQVKNFWKKYL